MNKNTLKDRPCTQPTWFSSAFSTALHQQSHNALHDGVNSLFDVADILLGSVSGSKYPPRNVKCTKYVDRIEHTIELALAGFKKADIKIIRDGKYLEITGSKDVPVNTSVENIEKPFIIENGISFKSFKQRFELNTGVDSVNDFNISSKFEDGLLTIKIVKKITQKATTTEINID